MKEMKELKFLEQNRKIDEKHVDKLCLSIKKNGYIEGLPISVTKDGYIIDGQHRYLACKKVGIEPKIVVLDINTNFVNSLMLEVNTTQKGWLFDDYVNFYAKQGNGNYIELVRLSKLYKMKYRILAILLASNQYDGGGLTRLIRQGNFVFDYSEKGLKKIDEKIKVINEMLNVLKIEAQYKLTLALDIAYKNDKFISDKFIQKCNMQRENIYSCLTINGYLRMIEDIYNYGSKNKIYLTQDSKRRNKNG